MNANVRAEVSTKQSNDALAQRRALLALRESHRAENRRKFLKYREEFGEPLQVFGVYDEPFPDEG